MRRLPTLVAAGTVVMSCALLSAQGQPTNSMPTPASSPLPEGVLTETLPPPQATLDLEWEKVEAASGYQVRLTPVTAAGGKSGQPAAEPLQFTVEVNKISERVPVGTYKLQVRSRDKESGHYGAWSKPTEIEVGAKVVELFEPANEAVVSAATEKRLKVLFRWVPVPLARAYTFTIWSDDINNAKTFRRRKPSLSLQLPTAKMYFWQVTFEDKRGIKYSADPMTFSFTLLGPRLLQPIVDREIGLPHVTKVAWSKTPSAERYEVKIFRRWLDEEEWTVLHENAEVKETHLEFSRLRPGAYRVEVTAHAKNRASSDIGSYEFVVKPTEQELAGALKLVNYTAPPARFMVRKLTKQEEAAERRFAQRKAHQERHRAKAVDGPPSDQDKSEELNEDEEKREEDKVAEDRVEETSDEEKAEAADEDASDNSDEARDEEDAELDTEGI